MKTLTVLIALGFAFANVSISRAQLVPKVVLVEDATNDECPPCQVFDPLYFAWLEQHSGSVLHISYHLDAPNYQDPISSNDPQDNQARLNYYGIHVIPGLGVGGMKYICEPDVSMVEDMFEQSSAEGSPIAMTVSRRATEDSVFVHVSIHPVQNLAERRNLVLRIAAVEREIDVYPSPMHHLGFSDTQVFVDPLRALMPDSNGFALALTTGDTAFDVGYDLRAQYDTSKLFEIAFVQDDSTKEEVQAASDRIRSYGMTLASTNIVQRVTADTLQPIQFLTNNNKAWTLTYKPTSPNVWPISVNGIALGAGKPVVISSGTSDSISLVSQSGKGSYSSGIIFATSTDPVTNDTIRTTWAVKFISPEVQVGYVYLGFPDSTTPARETAALDRLPYAYVPLSRGEANILGAWNPTEFPNLIVSCFTWPIELEDDLIASYMARGGNLFLTMNSPKDDVGDWWYDPNAWQQFQNLAHLTVQGGIQFGYDVSAWTQGEVNDPITASYAMPSSALHFVTPDTNSQYFGSSYLCLPSGSAVALFKNFVYNYGPEDSVKQDTPYTMGIRWDSTGSKLVYCSFEFRDLNDTDCTTITQNVLRWFNAPQMDVSPQSTITSDVLSIWPNPSNDAVKIGFINPTSAVISYQVIDVLGNVRAEGEVDGDALQLDVHSLANGLYYLRARDAETGVAVSGRFMVEK